MQLHLIDFVCTERPSVSKTGSFWPFDLSDAGRGVAAFFYLQSSLLPETVCEH